MPKETEKPEKTEKEKAAQAEAKPKTVSLMPPQLLQALQAQPAPAAGAAQKALQQSPAAIMPTAFRLAREVKPEKEPEKAIQARTLVESYGDVKIWREQGEQMFLYEVPTPRFVGEERTLINTLLQIATKVVPEPPQPMPPQQRRSYYLQRVLEIVDATPELKIPLQAREFYAQAVVREMTGLGAIDTLIVDDDLEEIMIIGPAKPIYVYHRKYGMLRTNIVMYNDADIQALIERIARGIGRRIDISEPLLDARLPDGTRVTASVPPASVDGSTMTLRKFRREPYTMVDFLNLNTMSPEVAGFLWVAVEGLGVLPANLIIAGGTASGKTTMLNVLCSFIQDTERVISIEDTIELNMPIHHWIRFESRPPGLERTGEITLDVLLKNALHMRPDRIIVGEIRAAEGYTLFSAMNVGHRGAMGTLHANTARETIIRLMSPPINIPPIMISPLNFILIQHRIHDRRKGLIRRVTELAEVTGVVGDTPQLQTLYHWEPVHDTMLATGIPSLYIQELSRFTGLDRSAITDEIKQRGEFLRSLADKGIRKLPEVWAAIQKYTPASVA
jgi:flagellar protein FlaI